jgi:cell wall-associated NlpC family hydrolase
MAIGNNLVVEAPHSGAAVRISPLGTGVQIRRPLG